MADDGVQQREAGHARLYRYRSSMWPDVIRTAIDPSLPPALRRMSQLADLSPADLAALSRAMERPRPMRAKREMIGEGQPVVEPLLIVTGWAARVRMLPDGRRQIVGFLLPGDLAGNCRHDRPIAQSTVVTVTDVTFCAPPRAATSAAMAQAYAVSHAYDEAYLIACVTRLGRLSAQERLYDLLLELYERLGMAGLVTGNSYAIPLTQELLADALGLTPVHVNRTVQLARRENDLKWKSGTLTLTDPARLAYKVGRAPTRPSAAPPLG